MPKIIIIINKSTDALRGTVLQFQPHASVSTSCQTALQSRCENINRHIEITNPAINVY